MGDRFYIQPASNAAFVKDYSLDAVTLELFHYDEREFARIQALPILQKNARRGEGATVREAVIDALEDLAVYLNKVADELRQEDSPL